MRRGCVGVGWVPVDASRRVDRCQYRRRDWAKLSNSLGCVSANAVNEVAELDAACPSIVIRIWQP